MEFLIVRHRNGQIMIGMSVSSPLPLQLLLSAALVFITPGSPVQSVIALVMAFPQIALWMPQKFG